MTIREGRVFRASYQSLAGKVGYEDGLLVVDLRLDQSPGVWFTAAGTVPPTVFARDAPEMPVNVAIRSSSVGLGSIEGVTNACTRRHWRCARQHRRRRHDARSALRGHAGADGCRLRRLGDRRTLQQRQREVRLHQGSDHGLGVSSRRSASSYLERGRESGHARIARRRPRNRRLCQQLRGPAQSVRDPRSPDQQSERQRSARSAAADRPHHDQPGRAEGR